MNRRHAAIIGAIAVIGVAAVIAILMYFQFNTSVFTEKELYTNVTINGLKDAYRVGEPIDFFVTVEGHGCDAGFPHVLIKQVIPSGQEKIIWSRFGEIRLFPAGYDCPLSDIYHVRHIGDVQRYQNDEQERLRTDGSMPIVFEQEGTYVVEVRGANVRGDPVQSEFDVVAD